MSDGIFDFINNFDDFEADDLSVDESLGSTLPSWDSDSSWFVEGDPDHAWNADLDQDGIPNFADHHNGPGQSNPFASSSLGTAIDGSETHQEINVDDISLGTTWKTAAVVKTFEFARDTFFGDSLGLAGEFSPDNYEEIDFDDFFSIPDDILSLDVDVEANIIVENMSDLIDPTEHYHTQEAQNSCAVAVQTDILNDFGIDVTESDMRIYGEEHGIFSEETGTTLDDVGKLLEAHNIPLEDQRRDFSINDLQEALESGEKVIIGLDAAEIWNSPAHPDNPLDTMGLLDIANAGHAVEFKGIYEDFAGNHYAIIDDPGYPGGQNAHIPLDDFYDAWADFGNFAIITDKY